MNHQQDPNRSSQHNQQYNHASNGPLYANQGSGTQKITHNNYQAARTRTGVAILVFLVLDGLFFIYGSAAYSGQNGDSADLWRAGIFLVLVSVTISLIRRWFRQRL